MKVYVINLKRESDRFKHIDSIFKSFKIDYEIFFAIDYKNFSNSFYHNFLKDRLLFIPSKPAAACYLSHYNLWKKIANGIDEYATIFEDDVHISSSFKEFCSLQKLLPKYFDVIRLETSTNRLHLSKKPVFKLSDRGIFNLYSTSWGAGGYILSKVGAKKILSYPLKEHRHADSTLFSYERSIIAKQLVKFQVNPAVCVQDKFFNNNKNIKLPSIIRKTSDTSWEKSKFYKLYTTLKFSKLSILKKIIYNYQRINYIN